MRIKFDQKIKVAALFIIVFSFMSLSKIDLVYAGQVGKLKNSSTWGEGKKGAALFFDDKDNILFVEDHSKINPEINNLTVSAWVNPKFSLDRWGSRRNVLAQRVEKTFTYELGFDSTERNYVFAINTIDNKKYQCSFKLLSATHENGQWKHLLATYDGSKLRVYRNSVLQNTCPASGKLMRYSDGDLVIGSWDGTKNFYKGGINDVRIYRRVLSQSEVSELYGFKSHALNVSSSKCPDLKANNLQSSDSSNNLACTALANKDKSNPAPNKMAKRSSDIASSGSSKSSTQTIPTVVDPAYTQMRKVFLNINPDNFDELIFSDYVNSESFIKNSGANVIEARINEGGKKEKIFGGNFWCKNDAHGNYSLCRYMTGGMVDKKSQCGISMNNEYSYALSHPENICNTNKWSKSKKGTRIWIGAGKRDNFIKSFFKKLSNKPMNRLCFEIELPQDRMSFPYSRSAIKQLVNTEVTHDNLDNLKVELGTYTSVYGSDQGNFKNDPEAGCTFRGIGTHFYHKPSVYGVYPLDKVYALNQNTVVACFAEAPSGVRSQGRPPYSFNPLMTVAGDNSVGQTNAYSYMSYLTRAYFDIVGGQIKFPATLKFNKVFALYENNDIQALSGNGAVLGVDMISDGSRAEYPFTIYNGASEDRTYRVTMMAEGKLPLKSPSYTFKIYLDDNQDGMHDLNENVEIKPNSLYKLSAQKDASFIIVHTPDFSSSSLPKLRYGRKLSPAGVTFQEVGRLRMTSYAIRTWQGTVEEMPFKAALLKGMVYCDKNSAYEVYAKWNHDKSNNSRLVRNTPDYRMAIAKMIKNKGHAVNIK